MRAATFMLYGLIGVFAIILLAWFALDDKRVSPELPETDAGLGATASDNMKHPSLSALLSVADKRRLELASMSSSFRNETFLVAVRNAGYRCVHFLEAVPSDLSNSGVWLMQCDDNLNYLVGVEETGKLGVEPSPSADTPMFLQREIETPLNGGAPPP